MANILDAYPVIRFSSLDAASELAASNAADDPDFTYTVEPSGDRFVIVIRDEDGLVVGAL